MLPGFDIIKFRRNKRATLSGEKVGDDTAFAQIRSSPISPDGTRQTGKASRLRRERRGLKNPL